MYIPQAPNEVLCICLEPWGVVVVQALHKIPARLKGPAEGTVDPSVQAGPKGGQGEGRREARQVPRATLCIT